jgi:ech hydrogenase subunit B
MTASQLILGILTLILAPIIALILSGIDRIFTARLQGRIGPPLFQPFYDMIKLFGKETIVVNKLQIIWAWGFTGFSAASLVLLIAYGDILLVMFTLGFAGICLSLGALSVRSPYSYLGGMRELMMMLGYEPILIAAAIAIYFTSGTYAISEIVTKTPLLITLPLVFLALLLVLVVKMNKSPFDISTAHHAHQELVKGVTTEYSGKYLALIELGHLYELMFVLALITLFWANPIWIGLIIAFVAFLAVILVDVTWARLTWRWMLGFSWIVGLGLVALNLAFLFIRRPS